MQTEASTINSIKLTLNLQNYADGSVLRGGSIRKSKELKTTMHIANMTSDLRVSADFLTIEILSSWLVLADESSSWMTGHVTKPYTMPVTNAPRCVLNYFRK